MYCLEILTFCIFVSFFMPLPFSMGGWGGGGGHIVSPQSICTLSHT